MLKPLALSAVLLASAANAQGADPLTKPIAPNHAARWLTPQTPVRIHGDTYYVGFGGLSVVAIKTSGGVILIDAGPPQAVAQVKANLRAVGLKPEDIRYVLNTESHWDHSAGIAAIQRDSGAVAVTSASGAAALQAGRWDPADPQAADLQAYPAVARVQAVKDGEQIRLGATVVTARLTPGHTPGSTSWTWRSCEAGQCVDIVFASSFSPISSDGFRFHPAVEPSFRRSIATVAALPCDILVTAHPDQSGFAAALKTAVGARTPQTFVDPNACRAYAAKYEALLDARIAKERSGAQ